MDQYFDIDRVKEAVRRTIDAILTERTRLVEEWDKKSCIARFFAVLDGDGRAVRAKDCYRQERIARRILFKVVESVDPKGLRRIHIPLTDEEIDAIREYWGK